jgi:GNAT superfamily N-acetyltransferase
MKLRPATADDLSAIVTMRDQLNQLELAGCPHASIQPLSQDEFAALWSGTFASPSHCWRIVEAEGRPVGFGLIYLVFPTITPSAAYLHWAYVEETYRRQGVGRLLLAELLGWAKARGADRVELQFIDGNQAAERFWTKMGFQPFARKCVHYLNSEKT